MSNDINLLRRKKGSRFSHETLLSYTKVAAIGAIIITFSLAVLVFLINRDPTLERIAAEQNTLLAQLTALHSKTAKDLIVLDRVKRLQLIDRLRGSMDQKIAILQQQIPTGAQVTNFSIDNTKVSITISSSSLGDMGAFIDNLTTLVEKKSIIKQLTIQGVISNEKTGTFLLTVDGLLI